MDDLMQMLRKLSEELDQSIKMLRKNGNAAAEAERDYQSAKNQTILRLKAEGYPATLIVQMVKGEQEVAKKMFDRDIAKVLYDTNKEHINIKKLQLRTVEEQVEREWHSG